MTDAADLRQALEAALGASYSVQGEIGRGGMSRVFLARDESLGRDVVVKVLAPELALGVSMERFAREIKLAASLQEPHIVPVISAGQTAGGLPFYTMPFVQGESLRVRLSHGRPSVGESVNILRDVARALAYSHKRGVIHRDIKPENVLLSFGTAVVTDFGIAKALQIAKARSSGGSSITAAGTSLGTPAYMAPEQAAGDEADARADLYSWGVMAYEMLAGVHPFPGKTTAQQYMAAHIAELPVHLLLKMPDMPMTLSALVMKCLEKDPAQRPIAATELIRALDDPALLGRQTPTTLAAIPAASRGGALRNVGLALIIALFAFGGPRLAARVRGIEVRPDSLVGTGNISTVAVLPFANIGRAADDEYLSDGMTDELAAALARMPGLRVAGRTSSYSYKGKAVNALVIGKALNVDGVIAGTVQRSGNRLRIRAELVSAIDGLVRWSDTYEQPVADVFKVQDDVTRSIVAALAPALKGSAAATAARDTRGTTSVEAYDLYLRGKFFFAKRGAQNIALAQDYFTRAIARDPRFARAYAALASSYIVMPSYQASRTDSLVSLAKSAARHAIAIDSTLPDAHLALALALGTTFDNTDAEQHLLRAIKHIPGDAAARQWHAENLYSIGRIQDGLVEARAATALDPLSAIIYYPSFGGPFLLRQFAEALVAGQRVLAFDSTYVPVRIDIGKIYAHLGKPDSAVAVGERLRRTAPPNVPGLRAELMLAYASAGRWKDADRVRRSILRDPVATNGYDGVSARIIFGDRRNALRVLENAEKKATDIALVSWSIGCDPMFDPLKNEPRYIALLARHRIISCPANSPWPIRTGVPIQYRLPNANLERTLR